jgi:hypothetical protein
MSVASRYLTAVGDFSANTGEARDHLRTGDKSRAISHAARATGNILQRFVYGSLLTLEYVIVNEPGYPPKDQHLKSEHGLNVAAAAGVLQESGVELPQSFIAMVELHPIKGK